MKGRLYFATKAQKEGKIMIKTHPCAQIFCCDLCGFEQVQYFTNTMPPNSVALLCSDHWVALPSKRRFSEVT